MWTTKKTVTGLDPGDHLEIKARNIVVDVRISQDGVPNITIECSRRGLDVHYYNKKTDVRQKNVGSEPHLMLCVSEGNN